MKFRITQAYLDKYDLNDYRLHRHSGRKFLKDGDIVEVIREEQGFNGKYYFVYWDSRFVYKIREMDLDLLDRL